MKKLFPLLLFFILWSHTHAQHRPQGSGQILHRLEKLKVLGSALYVAAHPDDENTLLLTWLSNEKMVRTAYISLTRGDGGQNLLGTEKSEYAGLLRTNELLGARSVDGGEQFFSRANDFGYTKTTEEALETWGEKQILSDLVYRIRKFQPDVIITRFPPDERAGHGHHSASSLLAEIAFDAAADPRAFPGQLKEVKPWQAKRLVWNFYNRGFSNTPPDDGAGYIQVDIGGYNPLLGASYGEIGAKARSMHRSQGFGAALHRGEHLEVLKHTKGKAARKGLFDDIDLTWHRIRNGGPIAKLIDEIIRDFNPKMPEKSIPQLGKALKRMQALEQTELVKVKTQEVRQLILDCAGIYTEFVLENYAYAPGEVLKGKIELTNRSQAELSLESFDIEALNIHEAKAYPLLQNKTVEIRVEAKLPAGFPISQPYWLWDEHPLGYYILHDENLRGLPMNPPVILAHVEFKAGDQSVFGEYPAKYKYVEPSFGEIHRPLEIRPALTVTPNLHSLVFYDNSPQEVFIRAKSAKDSIEGTLSLKMPKGWRAEPESRKIILESKFDETVLSFRVFPSQWASKEKIEVVGKLGGQAYTRGLNSIKYDHIPEITSFPEARIYALKLDLQKEGQQIGYIMGAGDEVPTALEQMGYSVSLLDESNLNGSLDGYDAILIGVRAYNVLEWLPFYHGKLMDYVQAGGNLICQYQTSSGSEKWIDQVGPYRLKLSHDRVSEEDAEVRFLPSGKIVFSGPNKLGPSDFDGWVQERGLYFASEWDSHYQAVFSMNDKNESKKEGGLLYTRHGKGYFVYTGISFFRELPAGVPGAYRLMANLISLK